MARSRHARPGVSRPLKESLEVLRGVHGGRRVWRHDGPAPRCGCARARSALLRLAGQPRRPRTPTSCGASRRRVPACPTHPTQVAIETSDPVDLGLSQIVVRDAEGRAQTVSDKSLTKGASDAGRHAWTTEGPGVSGPSTTAWWARTDTPVTGRIDFAVGEPAQRDVRVAGRHDPVADAGWRCPRTARRRVVPALDHGSPVPGGGTAAGADVLMAPADTTVTPLAPSRLAPGGRLGLLRAGVDRPGGERRDEPAAAGAGRPGHPGRRAAHRSRGPGRARAPGARRGGDGRCTHRGPAGRGRRRSTAGRGA